MLTVGLTGGIGSGKSSVARYFRDLGVRVLDADQIARQVVQPGELALSQIAAEFGAQVLNEAGELNRDWMRQQVFADPSARERLEAITHPLIRQRIVQAMAVAYDTPYLVVDIPLLIEQSYQGVFDAVLVVDCTPEQQLQRVQHRDGSDARLIKGIMAAQASRAERLKHATYVLDNCGSLEYLHAQMAPLHQALIQLARSVER
ncbi:MAG: dephospho-CoA kinase [Thiothrix nivea]|nr:MAG: dephospho-CoA kinase [Thiothrix nivea]